MESKAEGYGYETVLRSYSVEEGVAYTDFDVIIDSDTPGMLDMYVGGKGLSISGFGNRLCPGGRTAIHMKVATDTANSGIALLEKLVPEFTPLTEADDLDYSVEPAGKFFRLVILSDIPADAEVTVFDRGYVAYRGPPLQEGYGCNSDRVDFVIGDRLYRCR